MTAALRVNVVSIFPGFFDSPFSTSLLGRAIDEGIVEVKVTDPRDFAGPDRRVDDYPYGGGPGMVMAPDPLFRAVESIAGWNDSPLITLTPAGRRFDQELAESLAAAGSVTLICGRYEGIDQRVTEGLGAEEVSIGDYVLAGGEAAALAVIEAVARLVPGVLGNPASLGAESFSGAGRRSVEYPQYTRPAEYRGMRVPDVLLSGDHGAIADWRGRSAQDRTRLARRASEAPEEPA